MSYLEQRVSRLEERSGVHGPEYLIVELSELEDGEVFEAFVSPLNGRGDTLVFTGPGEYRAWLDERTREFDRRKGVE